jgi:hypothetical protein
MRRRQVCHGTALTLPESCAGMCTLVHVSSGCMHALVCASTGLTFLRHSYRVVHKHVSVEFKSRGLAASLVKTLLLDPAPECAVGVSIYVYAKATVVDIYEVDEFSVADRQIGMTSF